MRPLRFVSAAMVLAMFAVAAATYGGLGARVPTHLTLDGRADRWSDRSFWSWFAVPLLALAMTVAFDLLARQLARRPGLVNLPDRARLLQLPAARRAPVTLELARMLDLVSVGVATIFGVVQFQFVRVAAQQPALPTVVLAVAPVVLSVAILLYLARVSTVLDEAYRAWTAAGSPAE